METGNRPTRIALLLLVLATGAAIAWTLNDLARPEVIGAGVAERRPTASSVPVAASALPTRTLPSATPMPTRAAAPTRAPATMTPAPSSTPAPAIAGYAGHIVATGETLEQIAANGGSSPELIVAYNRLSGPPQAGRALIVPRIAGQTSALGEAEIMVRRGSSARPWVALTLDAGAGAEGTEQILDALRERGVRITFFLTGKWIAENPELTRRIVADGHELANHTYTHPDLTRASDAAIVAELERTEAALREVAPGAELRPFFRPPYGAYDERVVRVVQAEGYLPVYWTLDSLDSVGAKKTPAFLVERVTAKLTPEQLRGAILLAHCGLPTTAEALPEILDRFAEMGFEVRRLSEVLEGSL